MTHDNKINAAMETASNCRRDASIMRQAGFKVYAQWLLSNAKNAERWTAQAPKNKPFEPS